MPDNFAGYDAGVLSPYTTPHAIAAGAPASDVELPFTTRGILVDGAGVLSIRTENGDEITITNIARGVIHPIRATHVLTTNTAALVCWE